MLTFAFCTYNRADRLDNLVAAMRSQSCPLPFEILVVNNNSNDGTEESLSRLAQQSGPPLRWVNETTQGIVSARNRAISESIDGDILVFIDDDEIPMPGLLDAATDAILGERAQCAGGRVELDFTRNARPAWLSEELFGFLAAVDYGDKSFRIKDYSTPIWTANIAYDMRLFRRDSNLRFDKRYDRKGNVIGGGSDAIMFRRLVDQGIHIRYCPGMTVLHLVEPWRLKRSYFLKLHYQAGLRKGRFELPEYPREVFGMPPFLITQLLKQASKAIGMQLTGSPGALRQGMNASHTFGTLQGYAGRPNQ